jgi:hypothetical protein
VNDYYKQQGRTMDAADVVLDADAEQDTIYSPDLPVPYALTPQAEALLAQIEPEAGQ